MKNRGQVLVVFALMLPIILMLLGIVIDYGSVTLTKLEAESEMKRILKTALEENLDETEIRALMNKNLKKAINIDLMLGERIDASVTLETKTIFTHLLGTKQEKYKLSYRAYKVEDKIRIVKG